MGKYESRKGQDGDYLQGLRRVSVSGCFTLPFARVCETSHGTPSSWLRILPAAHGLADLAALCHYHGDVSSHY
jgi:hypothetical protein